MEFDKKISKIKLILTSFCCLLGLSCFCSAGYFITRDNSFTTNSTDWQAVDFGNSIGCVYVNSASSYYSMDGQSNDGYLDRYSLVCFTGSMYFKGSSQSFFVYSGFSQLSSNCPACPSQYTSLECQQEYSLIPVSSVDSNYCESNNLCSSSDCPVNTGDVSWSALYINNIQHLGGAIIRVDIPEEIDRDYTQGTGEFDLDIVGYNVDYEAIQNKIDIQNYKPSQEDFNNVIGVFAGYMPLIVILIGFVFILALIKKPFKSKL